VFDYYKHGFYNEKISLNLGLGFFVYLQAFNISDFLYLSQYLEKPSGKTLINLIENPEKKENWQKLRWEADPKSKWIKACLDLTLKKYGFLSKFIFKQIVKTFPSDELFQAFSILNGLILYFDPPEELAVYNDTEPSKTAMIDQDLWVFAELKKLEINEINNKTLTLQNLQNVLNYPQYLYFCRAKAIQDALILVNPNLASPEKDKDKKKTYEFNILKHYESFLLLMKGLDLEELDWYSEKADEHLERINNNISYQKLYQLFNPKNIGKN